MQTCFRDVCAAMCLPHFKARLWALCGSNSDQFETSCLTRETFVVTRKKFVRPELTTRLRSHLQCLLLDSENVGGPRFHAEPDAVVSAQQVGACLFEH